MATFVAACPSCNSRLKVPDTVKPGTRVKCPKCANPFPIPNPTAMAQTPGPSAPQRRTAAPKSNTATRKSGVQEAANDGGGLDGLRLGRKPSIGGTFTVAKANLGTLIGPMIGYYFTLGAVGGIVALFTLGTAIPALAAGYTIVAIAQLRGQPWTFGSFFGGFKFYVPLLLRSLLLGTTAFLCLLPGLLVQGVGAILFYNAVQGSSSAPPDTSVASTLVMVGTVVAAIGGLIAAYLLLRLSFYSEGLIVDKEFGAMDALKGSWRLSGTHQFGLILFAIAHSFIAQIGLLACGVGLFVTIPLAVIMSSAAYLAAVGKLREAEA